MKRIPQILGLIGLVVLGVGFFSLLVGRKVNVFVILHILIGAGLSLFGLLKNFASLQEYFQKRAGRAKTGAIIQMIFILIVIFLLGVVGHRHDWMLDVTLGRLYTLSEQTKKVLEQLPDIVKLTAYFPSEGYGQEKQLLKLYTRESEKLKLELIDPDKQPVLAEAKGVNTYGTIIFEYQGRENRITDVREESITNALIKITQNISPVVYFITGHGEADPEQDDKGGYSLIKRFLEDQNYQVRKLQLSAEGVPEDASLIVIAGPRGPFAAGEVMAIDKYLGMGGDAIFLLDPVVFTNLEKLLEGYGLEVGAGIIVDPVNHLIGMDSIGLTPVAGKFASDEEITRNLLGKLLAFPRARPLRILGSGEKEGVWKPLVYTAQSSYVETDLESLFKYGKVNKDPEDPAGEQLVAVRYREMLRPALWERVEGKEIQQIRIVVAGNSHFMRNMALDVYSNYLFSIELFNWATGEHKRVNIAPKYRPASRLYLTKRQTDLIFYSSVLIIPEILLIVGIIVWWRRKS